MSKNERKRPLSPHLSVYNIFSASLTSGPSFLNRVTGIGIFVGLFYVMAWLGSAALGPIYYDFFIKFITSWFGYLSLFGLSLVVSYYICNGIRYTFFEAGYGFGRKPVFISGIVMILCTIVLTLISWFFIIKTILSNL